MILYKSRDLDGIHFGNKSLSIGWGKIRYLYNGEFHDGGGSLSLHFDSKYLSESILADHPLVNWNDDIDSLF